MTTNMQRGSATIYAFPARGRFAASADKVRFDAALTPERTTFVAAGGSWYHEEAIREAEQAEHTRKN